MRTMEKELGKQSGVRRWRAEKGGEGGKLGRSGSGGADREAREVGLECVVVRVRWVVVSDL